MESSENNTMNSNTITNGNSVGSSSSGPANSRWNPTKEQISMLENLYREGIRTPNADQIQQITSRLRAFGHIEGKNVFYWFQNHKARQRQKQKQESLAYNIHRFFHNKASHNLHHYQPPIVFPPPPSPNVICSPYCLPQSKLGFYPQYPKVVLPVSGFKRRSISEKVDVNNIYACKGSEVQAFPRENNTIKPKSYQETLPLFPLHPTGILQGSEKPKSSLGSSTDRKSTTTYETASSNSELGFNKKPFFNFFPGQGSSSSSQCN